MGGPGDVGGRARVLAMLALLGALAACTDDPDPVDLGAPTTGASTTAPTTGPTPTTAPTVAPVDGRPVGRVRFDLRAGPYADDPAVLAWADWQRAATRSVRAGVLDPAAEDAGQGAVEAVRDSVDTVVRRGWTVPPTTVGRVDGVRPVGTGGGLRELETCLWRPSVAYTRLRQGSPVEGTSRVWIGVRVLVGAQDGDWRVLSLTTTDDCPGGPP